MVIVGSLAAIAAVRLLLVGAAGTVALSIWGRHRHAVVAAVISALRVLAAQRCERYPAQIKRSRRAGPTAELRGEIKYDEDY